MSVPSSEAIAASWTLSWDHVWRRLGLCAKHEKKGHADLLRDDSKFSLARDGVEELLTIRVPLQ